MANDADRPGEPTGILRDHLANERTLLAWTRTSLAAAALGFVIAKIRFTAGTVIELTPCQHRFGIPRFHRRKFPRCTVSP